MKVALAQINSFLGDFESNRKKIYEMIHQAQAQGCHLVVFPEAALFGYHPVDLLERPSIVKMQLKELNRLHRQLPSGIAALVGAITENPKATGKAYSNSAVLLQKNKKMKIFSKELLPTYDVFDEGRHIEPGDLTKNIFSFRKKKFLVTICEDIWAWPKINETSYSKHTANPIKKLKPKDVDFIVNLSASPFTDTKKILRKHVTSLTSSHLKAPLVYVNMVGGQDELIFDGGSFALDAQGKKIAQSPHFKESLNIVDFESSQAQFKVKTEKLHGAKKEALLLGLKDFVQKTGFKNVHLGLSGGIDSALVACLATEALGPKNVIALALPGPFNSPKSLSLAKKLAQNLKIELKELPIHSSYERVLSSFSSVFEDLSFGTVQENFQARLRGLFLMAYSNYKKSLLLNTSNKSELATGYSTLYGDLCGGLCVIGDLLKLEVYELSNLYKDLIPSEIITRPPSAELRPDQKDEDSLPSYQELDPIIEKLVENLKPAHTSSSQKILKMMMTSEFKRWQAPPILKVSNHAFGRGRRFPVAHKAIY